MPRAYGRLGIRNTFTNSPHIQLLGRKKPTPNPKANYCIELEGALNLC